ncbi:MAG TPA: MFS transporter [Terriglobales bacterium]|nr:MFS transporter [Terriglobales bacterium]
MNGGATRPPTRTARNGGTTFNPLRVLRHREFRLLWVGLAISAIGTWMQIVALSLLVLKITHGSAFALGTVSLTQALAFFLFALIGGSVADRIDKRRLLLLTQSASAGLAIVLGILTWYGVIQLWMIFAITFLNGTLLSFDQPARGALVPELVPKDQLMNAISLQANLFSGASTVGPALAGFAVGLLGYAANFFLNAASFIPVLLALYLMRVPDRPRTHLQSAWQAIRESLDTVRRDSVLPWVLAGYGALLCLGPSAALILPVFAVKVLHVGPERLGFLFTSVGLGSILGALILASFGSSVRKGYLYLTGILIWVVALAGFAVSGWFLLSLATLLVVGIGQSFTTTTTITLLQTRVPEQMRGRVMSLNTLLIMGIRPLGDFPAGALISAIGAPVTVLLSAALVGVYGLVSLTRRSIRSA